jgi:hypothetical protein
MTSFMDIAFNLVIAIGSLIGLIGSVRVTPCRRLLKSMFFKL